MNSAATRSSARARPKLLAAVLVCATLGCAGAGRRGGFDFIFGDKPSAGSAVRVRWTQAFSPSSSAYLPVEQATPGLDVARGRVYVGSTEGKLWALQTDGKRLYQYDARTSIEAQPAIDERSGDVYVATVRGSVIALRGEGLSRRWQVELNASISKPVLLTADAVYVVTDNDTIAALASSDGSILFRYHREPREGFSIAGHAGLTLAGNKLLTGFTDGSVVALDAGDGRVAWEVDTAADIDDADAARSFLDVDTTPVVVGDVVYVGSFAAGLFGLELASGTVHAHEGALKGLTSITATDDALILSSAEHGVLCLDLPDLTLRWRRKIDRGAPGSAKVLDDSVYVAESLGALLAFALADGHELGRLETGHGVTAPVAIAGRRGYLLSNAGILYAFTN